MDPHLPQPSSSAARASRLSGRARGHSFGASMAIHAGVLGAVLAAVQLGGPTDEGRTLTVQAQLEPREALLAPVVDAEPPLEVEDVACPEPVLEPMLVPEPGPPAPTSPEVGALDGALLTASAPLAAQAESPLGLPTLPAPAAPAKASRILRPRALPTGARPSSAAPEPAAVPAPLAQEAERPDTAPRQIQGACSPPDYPARALRMGWSGTVLLSIDVSAAGTVSAVRVETSSGHDCLDQAAVAAVKRWRFHPAKLRGASVASTVNKPIEFTRPAGR